MILHAIGAGLLIVLVSLSGAVVLAVPLRMLQRLIPLLVALAVGVLLGSALVHLVPEAIELIGSPSQVGLYTALGIALFFALEKALGSQHQHTLPDLETLGQAQQKMHPIARMNLVGDGVHKFVDGILIAGAFLIDPAVGWITTIAVAAHEVPKEIGDVAVLIRGGMKPLRAVGLNIVVALAILPGIALTVAAGSFAAQALHLLLPMAAGGFIYIAAADFVPTLHAESEHGAGLALAQVGVVMVGISMMYAAAMLESVLPVAH